MAYEFDYNRYMTQRNTLLSISIVTDILKVYTDVTHLAKHVEAEPLVMTYIQVISLLVRTFIHTYVTFLFAKVFMYFLSHRPKENQTLFSRTIIVLIYVIIVVRIVLHMLMNPLTAVILINEDLAYDTTVKIVFTIVRGYVAPLRDIFEVSLICLLLRV